MKKNVLKILVLLPLVIVSLVGCSKAAPGINDYQHDIDSNENVLLKQERGKRIYLGKNSGKKTSYAKEMFGSVFGGNAIVEYERKIIYHYKNFANKEVLDYVYESLSEHIDEVKNEYSSVNISLSKDGEVEAQEQIIDCACEGKGKLFLVDLYVPVVYCESGLTCYIQVPVTSFLRIRYDDKVVSPDGSEVLSYDEFVNNYGVVFYQ